MRDDAVSPVIGVMIMLTVTIVLAAVLMAFSGGLADTNLAAPSADLSAEFAGSGSDISLFLSHNGGEPLNPADIRVSAYVRTADAGGTSRTIADLSPESSWNAGDTICLSAADTQKLLGLYGSAIASAADLSTPVEISIHHIPSSEIIAKTVVLLEDA